MTLIHGRLAVLWLDDQAGTCRNVSADLNSITFNRSKNLAETTTFGKNSIQRETDGLRDASLDVTGLFNTSGDATAIVGLLDGLYSGSLVSRMQYLPAGSVSGSPVYTASMRMATFAATEPVAGVTIVNYSLALATGSMTQACVA